LESREHLLAGEFGGKKFVQQLKNAKTMELEQPYIIKFVADDGMQRVQILSRLRDHYGTEALSRTQVYSWINEVKRGRTDLNTVASPGRESDEGLAAAIPGKLDASVCGVMKTTTRRP
jgi:hypothetical protein